ncbi:polysaccharide deacetylase family protein [Streptomyces flavofungini]|uniref:Polysaccharide deacetylase family protein n=1 Tax=Streptomyces flavofungini TaxID=68200 RepID=A0ABS0X864_9ACTN|nr:polysaccharide deacetylase family protein [Streptomyces flavofungini]MBJ3809393.1 polysaccharide deacetylase family protein [Streptomyces flavofungini]GHC78008.1 polysaccharide deacetylase [Streptomyces flavofungini]
MAASLRFRALLTTLIAGTALFTGSFIPAAGSHGSAGHTTGATATPAPEPSPAPVARWYGSAIRLIPGQGKVVALTFNAAWNTQGLDTILKVLRQQRAPATFFLTGDFAQRHPEAVRAMSAAGHGIGNHSHSHPRFGELTPAERAGEITLAQSAIRRAGGAEPLPFFRFPYGDTTPEQIAEANALGYADIEWTTDTNGYKGTAGGMSVDKAVERALDKLVPGEIIQMHVGSSSGQLPILDAEALPRIIDAVRSRGYRVTDLRTLLTEAG